MDLKPHPKTGLHYAFVFPRYPAFSEIQSCYAAAADRVGWMSSLPAERLSSLERDSVPGGRLLVIFWNRPISGWNRGRSLMGIRFTETVARPEAAPPWQQAGLRELLDNVSSYDVLVVNTPTAFDLFRGVPPRLVLSPIGYDRSVMGIPDWSRPKEFDMVMYGTAIGRREWLVPMISERFGKRFKDVSGLWGLERKETLDRSRAVLYVNHWATESFATSRLWQAAASSAALITERGDAWPALEKEHYLPLPWGNREDPEVFLKAVEDALLLPLDDVARKAYQHLSQFTPERCVEDFIVPATGGMS